MGPVVRRRSSEQCNQALRTQRLYTRYSAHCMVREKYCKNVVRALWDKDYRESFEPTFSQLTSFCATMTGFVKDRNLGNHGWGGKQANKTIEMELRWYCQGSKQATTDGQWNATHTNKRTNKQPSNTRFPEVRNQWGHKKTTEEQFYPISRKQSSKSQRTHPNVNTSIIKYYAQGRTRSKKRKQSQVVRALEKSPRISLECRPQNQTTKKKNLCDLGWNVDVTAIIVSAHDFHDSKLRKNRRMKTSCHASNEEDLANEAASERAVEAIAMSSRGASLKFGLGLGLTMLNSKP